MFPVRLFWSQLNRKPKSCLWGFIVSSIFYLIIGILLFSQTNWDRNQKFTNSPFFHPSHKNFCEHSVASDKKLFRIRWEYLYYYRDASTIPWKSIVWCKVPKAGSTTLTKLFLRLAGAKNIENSTKIHQKLRTFYPKFKERVMTRRMHKSFKFVVVRDPFDRILSAYRDKLENYQRDLEFRDGYYYNTYGRYMLQTPVANSTIREPTWLEFVDYLIKTPVEKMDEHWIPISYLCSPCSVRFDAIIKMENFNEEIQLPLRKARIETPIEWAHKNKAGTLDKSDYFRKLTYKQVQDLYDIYYSDFELFQYSPNKYFRWASESQNESKMEKVVLSVTE